MKLMTVHELRSRWKPTKVKLNFQNPTHDTPIRMHRAFSWLQRCEKCAVEEDIDVNLICQWIAFNALYGQWDIERREPIADRECWRKYIERLLIVDQSNHIAAMLEQQRDLVMAILEDEYTSGYFWKEPSDLTANKSRKSMFDARTWYVEKKWSLILDRLLERIYLIRCQLVHGAATYGGQLNRVSLKNCVNMLSALMERVLLAMIDHGADEDWGELCYPPLD